MQRKMGFTHDNKNNITEEWYTPPWVFYRLMLEFDLDPCAPSLPAADWIPAKERYTLADNGLLKPWHGLVWLNPPYGNKTRQWLERMHNHREGIALLFSRTDTRWFHDFVIKADAILFYKGRISFIDGQGRTGNGGAGAGSMFVAWGVKSTSALARFRDSGFLMDLQNEPIPTYENLYLFENATSLT